MPSTFQQLRRSARAALVLVSAWAVVASSQPKINDAVDGEPQSVPPQAYNRTTGLIYTPTKGLKSPRNVTRPAYRISRSKADQVRNMGAPGKDVTDKQLSIQGCKTESVTDKECLDVLLLALTPAHYSSNNTRDTPGRRALISPAQDQGECSACVGFAATAAAEAAINIYKQQHWSKAALSEQEISFCLGLSKQQPSSCRPPGPLDCIDGAEYEVFTGAVTCRQITSWANRTCFKYEQQAPRNCERVKQRGKATICPSQLPPGGEFSMAYSGSPLQSMAQVKEQIMLAGGVLTSLTMSEAAFQRFKDYNSTSGIFDTDETLEQGTQAAIYRHAVFCYGWWDNPKDAGDGYWMCKNSWGPGWGLNGAFKIAYGAAYSMQTDYTFAVRFAAPSPDRVQDILQLFNRTVVRDTSKPRCVLFKPRTPQRLLLLADDLTVLDDRLPDALGAARIFADVVESNLGVLNTTLSASSRGPFRLCGNVVKLLRGVLPPSTPPPSPSPPPSPVPSQCLDPYPGTLPTRRASHDHDQQHASTSTLPQPPGALADASQLPKPCAKSNMTHPDPECADALLLALTPSKYSSNSTADTPGGFAFISPAQDQGTCAAGVSFAVTAAAEAAFSIYNQRSWGKLNLSEADYSFCRLRPPLSCDVGASLSDVVTTFANGYVTAWASRDCYPYNEDRMVNCRMADACSSQLPAGGSLELANAGDWLRTAAQIKEQIMLSGGVVTALALTPAFETYNPTTNVFSTPRGLPDVPDWHVLFCYGWWDNPCYADEGYWLCKNSWGQLWGINGSVKVAYGSAYIMPPDYTFALRFNKPLNEQVIDITQKLKPALTRDPETPECVVYRPVQPQRLVKLVDELTILDAAGRGRGSSKAVVLADVVAPNLGYGRNLPAARRGLFQICGKTAELLRAAVCKGSC